MPWRQLLEAHTGLNGDNCTCPYTTSVAHTYLIQSDVSLHVLRGFRFVSAKSVKWKLRLIHVHCLFHFDSVLSGLSRQY